MKYLHTFGEHISKRAFVDTNTVSKYTVEIDNQLAGNLRDVPVRVVAYTRGNGKIILTPNTTATTKEDMVRLQLFIVELLKTIAVSADGVIIRCYSEDEQEWAIVRV